MVRVENAERDGVVGEAGVGGPVAERLALPVENVLLTEVVLCCVVPVFTELEDAPIMDEGLLGG